MMKRFLIGASILVVLAGIGMAQEKKNPCTTPVDKKDKGWVSRHESFVERAKKGDVDVLFLGDSITHGWEGAGKKVWADKFEKFKPANFGISGDRTEHVLWRITEGKELEGISPKVAVLMIGTNNSGSNSAEQIADGIAAIVSTLRKEKPHIKVLVLAVFPRASLPKDQKDLKVAPASNVNPKIKEINEIIKKLDDGKNIRYLDIGSKFLDADGGLPKEIMPDLLHLSEKGYTIWADAITPTLEEMLK
jgi:lysophospholipase L1-like esterase